MKTLILFAHPRLERSKFNQAMLKRIPKHFLSPFDQTAFLCKMRYQPPFAIMGTHRLSDHDTKLALDQYERLLKAILEDRVDWEKTTTYSFLNQAVEAQNL